MMEILLQFTRASRRDFWNRKRAAYQRRRVFGKRIRPPGPSWWETLGRK